jgi:hypothetical protein
MRHGRFALILLMLLGCATTTTSSTANGPFNGETSRSEMIEAEPPIETEDPDEAVLAQLNSGATDSMNFDGAIYQNLFTTTFIVVDRKFYVKVTNPMDPSAYYVYGLQCAPAARSRQHGFIMCLLPEHESIKDPSISILDTEGAHDEIFSFDCAVRDIPPVNTFQLLNPINGTSDTYQLAQDMMHFLALCRDGFDPTTPSNRH